MYNEILYPTDGSDSSDTAFSHAVALAKQFDATLHILHVVNTSYQDIGATGKSLSSLKENGKSILAEATERAESEGVEVEGHLEEGKPFRVIVDVGADLDVIVMATRGQTGINRYLLGSVTEKVVRTSDTPVLTVRTAEQGES